jgi:hypothetical protein
MKRIPRNQVFVLSPLHRKILHTLDGWGEAYPPMVRDLADALGDYGTVLKSLYVLERHNWIEMIRDRRGSIRAIRPLARP